jgi:putative transposase
MTKFRSPAVLQKFASIQASIHDHFNQERDLRRRDIFKQNRSTALSEWQRLCAA